MRHLPETISNQPEEYFKSGALSLFKFTEDMELSLPPVPSLGHSDVEGIEDTVENLYSELAQRGFTDVSIQSHQLSVAHHAVSLGEELGLPRHELKAIGASAQVHDISKYLYRNELLNKAATLTTDMWRVIRHHPVLGWILVNTIGTTIDQLHKTILSRAILTHHKQYNNCGYPESIDHVPTDALAIHIGILTIADAVAAMEENRSYRSTLPTDVIISQLESCSGSQFDPTLTPAMIHILRSRAETHPE